MNIQKERRRFVRLNVLTDVGYAKRSNGKEERLSLAKNISAGGICLVVYDELRASDTLDLKIWLPDDKEIITAVGRVVWVKEISLESLGSAKRFEAGIEFIEIKDEDMKKINTYVFKHL